MIKIPYIINKVGFKFIHAHTPDYYKKRYKGDTNTKIET